MKALRLAQVCLLLFVTFLLPRPLTAQSIYGQISGRLTAITGTPISAAVVSVTSVQTGANARATSDSDGYFTISNLTPDVYQVDVQAGGFKRVGGITQVSADSTTALNSALPPGDGPTVLTQSPGGILKLDRTDVSVHFDSQTIEDVPLLDRNLTHLQLLVPGASPGKLFIPPNQNPQNGQPVNINGQHFSGTAFQLDGTETRDPLEGIVVINPTLDSVGEMKVTTQGYAAEFGEATAGVVTIQTKGGSNIWHGDAFGFRRTGFGQADDPFSPGGVPPTKYNIFGGSFGGPIIGHKLFIFSDYQGTRSSQGANLLLSVPSQNVRSTCLGQGASGFCDLSDYRKFITCLDPTTQTQCLTDSEGNYFNGYQIPNSGGVYIDDHVSNQSVAVLALVPQPNQLPTNPDCGTTLADSVCNNYLATGQEVFHGDQVDIRTDYDARSSLRLFGRYSFGEFYDNGAPAFGISAGGIGTNPSGFAGVARTRNHGISTGFTYRFTQKLLTDFRFGYFRYRLNVNAQDYGQIPTIEQPGNAEILNISSASTGDPFATGLPDFEIPALPGFSGDYLRLGYSGAANSCNCPLREREQQFQLVNNWTRTAGKHMIKWGADIRFLQNYRLVSDRPPTGYFDFSPGSTGLGLATFLLGDVSGGFDRTISSAAAVNAGEHQKRLSFYGQDTMRINSRLTVNYGLRWEVYFPQTVTGAGGFLIPDLTNHDSATTYFSNGLPLDNTTGGISGSWKSFAPRFGLAYLVNPTTVVRAGYARSFDAGYAGDIFGIAATENPPVTVDQNVGGVFNLMQGPPPFVFPAGARFSLLDIAVKNAATSTSPASGAFLYGLPSQLHVPTVDSWNLTIQHELTTHLYFELAYVGNKGTHVFTDSNSGGTSFDLNQPSLQNLIMQTVKNGVSVTGLDYKNCKDGKVDKKLGPTGAIFTYGSGTSEQQYCLTKPGLRTFYQKTPVFSPILFSVNYFGNNASNNYNSLQTRVHKQFNHGYSLLAHYTWSKGLDYESNYFASDPAAGYGSASFDIRRRFVMTNIWELPIGRGKAWFGGIGSAADRFLGGWTLSAITTWQSGFPFTPTYHQADCAKDTDVDGKCRPDRVGTVHISGNREQYFTTTDGVELPGSHCVNATPQSATPKYYCGVDPQTGKPAEGPAIGPWRRPGAGQIGSVGRNSLTGPGFFQSDIGLAKIIRISEGSALRFRADAINAFNKVNLGQPNTCVDCADGGTIASLAPGAIQREFQFSLRIEF